MCMFYCFSRKTCVWVVPSGRGLVVILLGLPVFLVCGFSTLSFEANYYSVVSVSKHAYSLTDVKKRVTRG